jgi:hypothetical protein
MTIKEIIRSKMLYDSTDDKFYDVHKLQISSEEIFEFKINELIDFEELEKKYSKDDFQNILNKYDGKIYKFEPIPEFIIYKNEDGLHVYFKETEKYLAIFSLGEFQPARYKIKLESLFIKI